LKITARTLLSLLEACRRIYHPGLPTGLLHFGTYQFDFFLPYLSPKFLFAPAVDGRWRITAAPPLPLPSAFI